MRRIILILAGILLLAALAIWWFRLQGARQILDALLSRYSPIEIEYELTGAEPPVLRFSFIRAPALGISAEDANVEFSGNLAVPAVSMLKEGKLSYRNSNLDLQGVLTKNLRFTWKRELGQGAFEESEANLSESALDAPSFFLHCQKCRMILKRALVGKDGWELEGGIDLEKIRTSLSTKAGEELLQSVRAEGQLRSQPSGIDFELKTVHAAVFGGKVTSAKDALAKKKKNCWAFPLQVERIDIEKILKLYPTGQVNASGLLSGKLPFTYCAKDWLIDNAQLRSAGPGTIKLLSPTESGNEQVDFAFRALRDFEYSQLKATFSMHSDGKMEIALNLEGVSKSLNKNTPLVVNLNVEENLWALLESFKVVEKITEKISGGQPGK